MTLTLLPQTGGDELRVEIGGVLDEYTDFTAITTPTAKLVIDLSRVTRCNSMGVMRWTRFLRALPPSLSVRLERCPTVLVKQFNLYRAFLEHPGLVVDSFHVAMACNRCDKGQSLLVEGAPDSASVKLPSATCACGGSLELDGPREAQLRFLDRRQP